MEFSRKEFSLSFDRAVVLWLKGIPAKSGLTIPEAREKILEHLPDDFVVDFEGFSGMSRKNSMRKRLEKILDGTPYMIHGHIEQKVIKGYTFTNSFVMKVIKK